VSRCVKGKKELKNENETAVKKDLPLKNIIMSLT
jgi:hypothetical protein